MSRTIAAVPLALALAFAALPARAAQEKPEAKAEEAVARGLKSRIFAVKSRDPEQLFQTVRLLGSGAPGAWMTANRDLATITARDYPENLATIGEALQRLDVPGPAVPDVELVIHVLEARRGDGASGELPGDLKETVAALRGTLAYKGYRLLTTFTQRVKDGTRGVSGEGAIAPEEPAGAKAPPPMQMEWRVARVSVVPAASGPSTVTLEGLKFEAAGGGKAQIQTDVTLKEGEQVVVGTSVFRDRGLVLVVSARRGK